MASSPGAWKATRDRTRHFKVWLKHSIASLSHAETVFGNEQENEEQEAHNHVQEQSSRSDDYAVVAPLCHNIDDAMNSLYDGLVHDTVADFQTWQQQEYDWILDGHVSFQAEQERSRQLLEELQGPDLDDFFRREVSHMEHCEAHSDEHAQAESEDDEFGDFQMAQDDNVPSQHEASPNSNTNACEKDSASNQNVLGEYRAEETDESNDSNSHRKQSVVEVTDAEADRSNSLDTVGECRVQESDAHSDERVDQGTGVKEKGALTGTNDVPREILYHKKVDPLLYDSLPLMDDVSSPEGRFTRRQHLEIIQEENDDETDLRLAEHNFSNPEWDATLDALRSMPWEHVPILYHNVDPTIVEDFITQRLSQVDACHALVHSMLMKQASKQTLLLSKGNSEVHEMYHNLSMAEMYVERSQSSIAQARGSEEDCTGLVGATVLLHEFDRRDQYASLQRLLNKINGLYKKEQELNDCISSFGKNIVIDHGLVLERARQLHQTANDDEDLSRLECLNDLRGRTSQVLDVFRNKIEESLCSYIDNLCHNWSSCSENEYGRLFRAMLAMQDVPLVETEADAETDIVRIWAKCILETLCFQADKCFARALLDPTDSIDSEFDKELIHLGYELRQDSRDAVKLISLTHNLVTIRFDFEANCHYLPMVYHRLCALLTEVLHAHHILAQHHKALQETGSDKSTDGSRLNQVGVAIRAAKVDIWRCCEQVLVKCLDQYHHFAAKKALFPKDNKDEGMVWMEDLEGLYDVLRLTQQFLSIGYEFLDSDQLDSAHVTSLVDQGSDSELREKLCDVFRKHLRAIHVEAMTSLGASLFNESWRLVPLRVGGIACETTSENEDRQQLIQEVGGLRWL